jgi:hypothetical protein
MKRLGVVGLSAVLVCALAGPAVAGRISVNAARNILAWGHNGEFCDVSVDDFFDYEVTSYCFASGSAWFTVRVTGVGAGALTAKAFGTGDCAGKTVKVKRKSGGVAVVRVRNVGEFECAYKSATVRW